MENHCDICGVGVSGGGQLTREALPFRGSRKYCPACLKRLHDRAYLVVAVIALLFGGLGLYHSLSKGGGWLDSMAVRSALFCLLQWLLTFPHELGHALAARLLGFKNIRILVGTGRPLLTLNVLGFPWIINLIPFGGLTFATPGSTRHHRRNYFLMVLAGPAANVLALAIAGFFLPATSDLFGLENAAGLFGLANLTLLLGSLIPWRVQTPFGTFANDGLAMWNILFALGKEPETKQAAKSDSFAAWFLKWFVVCCMGVVTVSFWALFAVPLMSFSSYMETRTKVLFMLTVLPFALFGLWATRNLANGPIAASGKEDATHSIADLASGDKFARSEWVKDTRRAEGVQARLSNTKFDENLSILENELKDHPADPVLLHAKAETLHALKRYGPEREVYEQILAAVPAPSSGACAFFHGFRISCIALEGRLQEAEEEAAAFLAGSASADEKLQFLDLLACVPIFQNLPASLALGEKWIRTALEMAPGALTMKGTLGSILAEMGRDEEAEPLLRECHTRSPALNDQGITAIFLAVIEARRGNKKAARRLAKRAAALHPEPWLLQKAQALNTV